MFAKVPKRPLFLIELACWIAGIGSLVFYVAQGASQRQAAADGLSYFIATRTITDSDTFTRRLDVGAPNTALWSAQRIKDYERSAGAAGVPIGVLRIPAVHLVVPIYEGTSDEILKRGAGRVAGTAKLNSFGNSGIAAHRDSFFRPLKGVARGDVILVETVHGTEQYRIEKLSIVSPSDVHVLDETQSQTITLVTCYPFYFVGSAPQRFIVVAQRIAATS